MVPAFWLTKSTTPLLPCAAIPTGHFTVNPEPAACDHSELTFARYDENTLVVPLPSERCTTMMAACGKDTPGFSRATAGSCQLMILPRKIPARVAPLRRSGFFRPGRL